MSGRGMIYEDAIFQVIFENVENHKVRQNILKGVLDIIERWGLKEQEVEET